MAKISKKPLRFSKVLVQSGIRFPPDGNRVINDPICTMIHISYIDLRDIVTVAVNRDADECHYSRPRNLRPRILNGKAGKIGENSRQKTRLSHTCFMALNGAIIGVKRRT